MAALQEQEITFSGVVGSLPLIYGANVDKTRDQMNNWRWDNPSAFGDQVDRSNPQTTSSGKEKAQASISLSTVAMISGQRLSHQAAGSTGQATSWPLDH